MLISKELWEQAKEEKAEWQRKVDAGMPRCEYGNEGGPCMNQPEENGWCRAHRHIAVMRERLSQKFGPKDDNHHEWEEP